MNDASWFRRHRRFLIVSALVVFVGVAAVIVFAPSYVARWSRLNNEEQELDLNSGQSRFSRYFLYCLISQEIRPTAVSEALAGDAREPGERKWVMVNIFQPGLRVSPHFTYHAAFAEIRALAMLWEVFEYGPGARTKTARQLLRALRQGGRASRYVSYLLEWTESRSWPPPPTADDIPDDLVARSLGDRAAGAERQERTPE